MLGSLQSNGRYVRKVIEMTEKNIDIAKIYDNLTQHMTVKGVFGYVGIDVIPFRAVMRRDTTWK